jgi:hypothetical protein
MKSYIVTEEQFNRLFDYDEKLDKKIKVIQNFVDTNIIPLYPICKSEVYMSKGMNLNILMVRLYFKEKMTEGESDAIVDDIWTKIYNMFGESPAVHRVYGAC